MAPRVLQRVFSDDIFSPSSFSVAPTGMSSVDRVEIEALLQQGVEHEVFPGAVLLVSHKGKVVFEKAVGHLSVPSANSEASDALPLVTPETVYDIAGLTASVVTTSALLRLVDQGLLRLEDRVSRYIEGFGVLGKSPIAIHHLLSHTSGLPHWHPFFEDLHKESAASRLGLLTSSGAKDFILTSIVRSSIKPEQIGKYLYSDVGLIVLGAVVESVTGLSLDRAFFKLVSQPLTLKSSHFIHLDQLKKLGLKPARDIVAPTEQCSWRDKMLWGEVHDDNAWTLGGVAGHSGLFTTARDLYWFSREMLRAVQGRSKLFSSLLKQRFLEGIPSPHGRPIKLGWDSPSRDNGMLDSGLSPEAFGCNGFTGCSLWIDPALDAIAILMSNRVHPQRSNKRIQSYRPELYRLVIRALKDPQKVMDTTPSNEVESSDTSPLT
jgi:serine-type D-Ala-D-Ala carboxypeptidase